MTYAVTADAQLAASAAAIRSGLGVSALPATLLILGSGFKGFEATLTEARSLELSQIPHFPVPSVAGHGGALVVGKAGGHEVAVLTGRAHLYEGHSPDAVVYPIRALARLGVKRILLTNASGSLSQALRPGEVVLIRDQINFTGMSCLSGGAGQTFGPQFVDMSTAFCAEWRGEIKRNSPDLKEGVYIGVLGPAYETPAEARLLGLLGGEVVGMSTVQEVIAARQLGLKVACLSFVTNWSGGLGESLEHAAVLALVEQHKAALYRLLSHTVGV